MFSKNNSPKYHIGDSVWSLVYSKAVERKICGVVVLKDGEIRYYLELRDLPESYGWEKEKDIFISKSQLLESL